MPVTNAASGIKPGTVAHFAASTAPAGWLKANGATISRATYAALFLAIGTTYGAGDGATTFVIPDLRGEFVRGLDDGRGIDAARAIGSVQAGAVESHVHNISGWVSGGGGLAPLVQNTTSPNNIAVTNAYGGTETRPRNVAMLACIKY